MESECNSLTSFLVRQSLNFMNNTLFQLADEVEGAALSCDQELNIFKQEKHSRFTWIFKVESQVSHMLTLYDILHFENKPSAHYDNYRGIIVTECILYSHACHAAVTRVSILF